MSPEKSSEQTQKPENIQIPKSREIFAGDINAAVITIQRITGKEITPSWWDENVQKGGAVQDTDKILDNFDDAFARLIQNSPDIELPKFTDRDLAELKAIEEMQVAIKSGRIKEEELDQYVDDLVTWLDQEFPDKNKKETEKGDYEKGMSELLNSERTRIDIPNNLGICFELNNPDLEVSDEIRESLGLSVVELEKTLGGLDASFLSEIKVVLCQEGIISGGGQALAREKLIILDISKPPLITETEEYLSQSGFLEPGDWSKLSVPNNSALGLTLVHEIGHILEFDKFGDYGIAISGLDTSEAPTKYGESDSSEDFAESFAYLVFNGQLSESRMELINKTLSSSPAQCMDALPIAI